MSANMKQLSYLCATLSASLQSRAFVSVMAREYDPGPSVCTTADGSSPSHSSCKFPLSQLAEIHLCSVALITQLCPKQHTDFFVHSKVIQCPEPQPSEPAVCRYSPTHWLMCESDQDAPGWEFWVKQISSKGFLIPELQEQHQ